MEWEGPGIKETWCGTRDHTKWMVNRHPPFSKLEILNLSRLVDSGNPEKWIGVPALQSLSIFEPRITKGMAPSMVHFSVSRPSFNGESCHARLARRKRDLGGAWIVGSFWAKKMGLSMEPYRTPLHSFSQRISVVWFLRPPSQVVSHNHSLDHKRLLAT